MQESIKQIFEKNIELLSLVDKAVIYFREGRYDKALESIAQTGDGINMVAEAILNNREYFRLVSTDSVAEMLKGILEAKRNRDYILLADLYEMQLSNFICSVQELIMKQEDYFAFEEAEYMDNTGLLSNRLADSLIEVIGYKGDEDEFERTRVNQNALLQEPLNPSQMLDDGYCVEFTSCGLMTAGAIMPNGKRLYLHTNGRVAAEAFLLAKSWYDEKADTYIIYGFGMGYHIAELAALAPDARIIVFESDMNILKLYCAFSRAAGLLTNRRINVIYDPDFIFIKKRLGKQTKKERLCIHYPSFRRIGHENGHSLLAGFIPWCDKVEEC